MKRYIALLTVLFLTLAGCMEQGSRTDNGRRPVEGSRTQPYAVGHTAVYEGLDTATEYGSFRLKLQMQDVIRGDAAEQIYLADSDIARATDIPEGKELMLVRMSVKLLESQNDAPLQLGSWTDDLFLLVSERGETYEPFSRYGKLRQHVFTVLEPGDEQIGHLLFLVDAADNTATMVFMASVRAGIWFDPNIVGESESKNRIDPSDWGLDDGIFSHSARPDILPDAEDTTHGGTVEHPLPPGEWGVYRLDGDEQRLELELMVLQVERGTQALMRVGLQAEESLENINPETEELLAVQLRVNLLVDSENTGVNLAGDYWAMQENGQTYNTDQGPLFAVDNRMKTMFQGATQDGWVYFVVGQGENLLWSPGYSERSGLWFTTDLDAVLADGLQRFESSYEPEAAYMRDTSARQGSLQNPLPVGRAARFESAARGNAYTVDIAVGRITRGSDAEAYVDSTMLLTERAPEGKELLCVQLEASLLYSDGASVRFAGESFRLISSGRVEGEGALPDLQVLDPLGTLYPGQTAQGNLIFYVDVEDPAPLLCYPASPAQGDAQVWFELAVYGPAAVI